MLAERKQKQKWSLNPRGKIWSEDSNKFGQKLLEKMGWSAGKGLGAKGDGITEHIKVRYKNDCQGIGFKESDDQWTQHEDKFSELLSSLSGCKESDKDSSTQLQSLEKKSQTSKARVHYHKFTRGKDLSRYSEKDLANIFGKKSLKETVPEKTPEVVEDKSENDSFGVQTLNGGSMLDYFKKKLSSNKKYTVNSEEPSVRRNSESENEVAGFGFGNGNSLKSSFVSFIKHDNVLENGNIEEPYEKIKKKKKFESLKVDSEDNGLKVDENFEINDEEQRVDSTKKKKKRKSEGELELAFTPVKKKFKNFENLNSLNDEEKIECTPVKKSKKKSKKEANDSDYQCYDNGQSNPAFEPMFTKVAMEKHHLEVINEEDENSPETPTAEKSASQSEILEVPCNDYNPKLKKKKKKENGLVNQNFNGFSPVLYNGEQHEGNANVINESALDPSQNIEEQDFQATSTISKKKKKKYLETVENPCFSLDDSVASLENTTSKYEVERKKKPKKVKINNFEVGIECHSRIATGLSDECSPRFNNTEQEGKIKRKNIVEENILDLSQNNEKEISSKSKKSKKEHLEAVENSGFNFDDSVICPANSTTKYEVVRKKKHKNSKIMEVGSACSSTSDPGLGNECSLRLCYEEQFQKENKSNVVQENIDQSQNNEENDCVETPSKSKKKRKKHLEAVENPGFNPEDSGASSENLTFKYEVKRKEINSRDNNVSQDEKKKRVKVIDENVQDSLQSMETQDAEGAPSKSKKKKRYHLEAIENPGFNFDDSIASSENTTLNYEVKRKEIVNPRPTEISYTTEGEKEERKKKKKHAVEENVETQGYDEIVSKTRKRKRNHLEAVENLGFNLEDSIAFLEDKTIKYEVKRKENQKNVEKDHLETYTTGDSKPIQDVNKVEVLEMPIVDEEVMLNVVNTPVVKKENDGKRIERRKSVRFSDVNQSIFINNMDSPADLRKNGHGAFDNEGYDEVGNQIEENIDTLSKQLDDYQAEVENDLNEAKMEVMVGEMGDPDGENEILPNGDVKLKFKYADFGKIPRWYRKNGEVNAKTSYRHLIKGDIVLGFKNTNLDDVLGYKRITKQEMGDN